MQETEIEMGRHYAAVSRKGNALNAAGALVLFALIGASLWGNGRALWLSGAVFVGLLILNVAIQHSINPRHVRTTEFVRLVFNGAGLAIGGHLVGWVLPVWLLLPFMALALDDFGGVVVWACLLAMWFVADVVALCDGVSWIYPATFTMSAIFCRLVVASRFRIIRDMFLDSDRQRRALAETQAKLREEMVARERAELDLRQAHKLEAVGRLATGVAHELNTPLQSALLSVEFIAETVKDLAVARASETAHANDEILAEIQDAASLSVEGLKRASDIIRALRQFAGPEAKAESLVDVNQVVTATLAIATHEFKYVADVDTDLGKVPNVSGHAGELGQVVLNLLVNAAQAIATVTKAPGARGRIGVRTSHEGDRVVIAVSDTGCGIPEAIKSRIFDLYFTTKEFGTGTGQGLSLSRAIVVDHYGGLLDFESSVGKGSTFYVRLPVVAAKARAAA